MFSNVVVIALTIVAGELRLPALVAALGRPPSRAQTTCLKRVVRLTSLWCRDVGETRVAGGHTRPAMETNMHDLTQSFTPICKGLYTKSSFSRVSVLAAAPIPAPIDVARLDLPAQLNPFCGEKFLVPSLHLAFLEPRVLPSKVLIPRTGTGRISLLSSVPGQRFTGSHWSQPPLPSTCPLLPSQVTKAPRRIGCCWTSVV